MALRLDTGISLYFKKILRYDSEHNILRENGRVLIPQEFCESVEGSIVELSDGVRIRNRNSRRIRLSLGKGKGRREISVPIRLVERISGRPSDLVPRFT